MLKKSGWVLRTFMNRNVSFLRQLWKSIIVPHQDYCSILWSPVSQAGDKLSPEGPQRSFTKKAWDHNYWDRLTSFTLYKPKLKPDRKTLFNIMQFNTI